MTKALVLLKNYLANLADGGVCIAFSGGVDSAVILKAACEVMKNVHAITLYTPFHSPMEPKEATNLAAECGAVHNVIEMESLSARVMQNPPDRCYLCKKDIFMQIKAYAANHSLAAVLDGTNADDLNEYRPGLRALKELGVKSPLAELGINKDAVREIAAELGLSIAKKPSAPCLATRFPYDTPINLELLPKVDRLERFVKSLGIAVVRARVHGVILRLEVLPEDFPVIMANPEALADEAHKAGLLYVTLDLEGFRSGSMDLKPWGGVGNGHRKTSFSGEGRRNLA